MAGACARAQEAGGNDLHARSHAEREVTEPEEYQLICGSSANLATPATPTITARTDGLQLTMKSGNDNWVFDRE